jgi:hypothetical protein
MPPPRLFPLLAPTAGTHQSLSSRSPNRNGTMPSSNGSDGPNGSDGSDGCSETGGRLVPCPFELPPARFGAYDQPWQWDAVYLEPVTLTLVHSSFRTRLLELLSPSS